MTDDAGRDPKFLDNVPLMIETIGGNLTVHDVAAVAMLRCAGRLALAAGVPRETVDAEIASVVEDVRAVQKTVGRDGLMGLSSEMARVWASPDTRPWPLPERPPAARP